MPWQEVSVMTTTAVRRDVQAASFRWPSSVDAIGFSRPVAYKWLARFEAAGTRDCLITPSPFPARRD